MPAYILGKVRIHDPATYAIYVEGFGEILSRFAGEVVAVDHAPEALEGRWEADVAVLLRFSDRAAAEAFWRSPEYRDLVRHRHAAAEAEVLLLSGG